MKNDNLQFGDLVIEEHGRLANTSEPELRRIIDDPKSSKVQVRAAELMIETLLFDIDWRKNQYRRMANGSSDIPRVYIDTRKLFRQQYLKRFIDVHGIMGDVKKFQISLLDKPSHYHINREKIRAETKDAP